MHAYIRVRISVCVYAPSRTVLLSACTFVCVLCSCTGLHVCVRVCVRECVCVRATVYVRACVGVWMRAYVQ